jgi:hypothetical protein
MAVESGMSSRLSSLLWQLTAADPVFSVDEYRDKFLKNVLKVAIICCSETL